MTPDIDGLRQSDELIVNVAQRLQLTKTEHDNNRDRYEALAEFIDAEGSVLHDTVVDIFPSGSNAIDAAIRGLVKEDAPDVDAVIVLNLPTHTSPKQALELVREAITRSDEKTATYRNCIVEQHSRCITVVYSDESKVDLMPVIKLSDDKYAPIMQLFHYDDDDYRPVIYTKKVSPIGFKNAVKEAVEVEKDTWLYENVTKSMHLADTLILEKAEVADFPEQKQFEEKSPRIVVLQLLKRFRDIRFQGRKGRRKPPSVVLAAMAIDASFGSSRSLIDEMVHVAKHMRREIEIAGSNRLDIRNPGYNDDVFTDRWPEPDTDDQVLWYNDLNVLISELIALKDTESPSKQAEILERLFGQKVANHAVELLAKKVEHSRKNRKLAISSTGASIMSAKEGPRTTSSSERFGGSTS